MTFDKVIKDLKQMIGKKLHSIRPGAELVLNDIDVTQNRIVVTSSSGVTKTRPLNELKIIWQKLHEQPAVHVDEALHGSGTSRNQPETILANLAYIEWFKFNNKKHITYMGKNTHSFGSIKQMDEFNAEVLRDKLRGNNFDNLSVIVITKDIAKTVNLYGNMTGILANPINSGIYLFNIAKSVIAFVSVEEIGEDIPEGTYTVIKQPSDFVFTKKISINKEWFCVKSIGGLNILIKIN